MAGQDRYTIIDLFAGIGGLSLGFREYGFDLLYANDNNRTALETFKINHPGTILSSDSIEGITGADILSQIGERRVNVIVGGVPCQSFSMAGYRIRTNRAGIKDPRSYMFKHFVRIVKDLKPEIAIIENVRGLLSMSGGSIRDEIISDLTGLGYKVDYKVLNAADYGAPQLRHRVFFIANRLGIENQFPKATHNPNDYFTVGEAIKNLPNANHKPRQLEGIVLERVKLIQPGNNWTSLPKNMQTKSNHSGAYGRLDPNKPARTLTTRFDTPSVGYVTHPYKHRTLTVREGARLQGFPDSFIISGTTMEQYKQVGNAVPVHFSRAWAKTVKSMLDKGMK